MRRPKRRRRSRSAAETIKTDQSQFYTQFFPESLDTRQAWRMWRVVSSLLRSYNATTRYSLKTCLPRQEAAPCGAYTV